VHNASAYGYEMNLHYSLNLTANLKKNPLVKQFVKLKYKQTFVKNANIFTKQPPL
jgi:hypothetical protein